MRSCRARDSSAISAAKLEVGGLGRCNSRLRLGPKQYVVRIASLRIMPQLTVQQVFELALQHHRAGRLADAEALYRQILAAQPHHADALHYLGVIAHQVGRHELAVEWINRALALNPNNSQAYSNLGEALLGAGLRADAITAFRRSLSIDPGDALANYNLGNALRDSGRLDEAIAAFRRALEIKPDYPVARNNLGGVLKMSGRLDEAITAYQEATKLEPGYAEAHINLGVALNQIGRLEDAAASFRRAIQLKSDIRNAHINLGHTLMVMGCLQEAVEAFSEGLLIEPEAADIRSNLLLALNYSPHHDLSEIVQGHVDWFNIHTIQIAPSRTYANNRNPARPLRIGYVSADFRDHVVGRNIWPLFQHHHRSEFEIVCYATGVQDHLTRKFQHYAGRWRDTSDITDAMLDQMIRDDEVDILIDLSQHTSGNRLLVFAHRPAPVQVSFAGYPESTGLEAIGYRISGKWLERNGTRDADGLLVKAKVHEQVYLTDSFWCYDPCGMEMAINELPAQANGTITFGSLNNFCKVNEPLLKLWARVLEEVKDSRLIILTHDGSHRQRTRQFLEAEGVETHRIEFVTPRPRKEYLELYHRLDVVLDTFPYNGHTTSLDALWMGVPVVSLCGERPVSRAGLSQLSNLGLPELVAFTEDQYVDIATQLANDLPRLNGLRATLRKRMEKSVLMDGPHFARQIEACYRSMWRQWCESQAVSELS